MKANECLFANDAPLLATSKRGADQVATNEYMLVGN